VISGFATSIAVFGSCRRWCFLFCHQTDFRSSTRARWYSSPNLESLHLFGLVSFTLPAFFSLRARGAQGFPRAYLCFNCWCGSVFLPLPMGAAPNFLHLGSACTQEPRSSARSLVRVCSSTLLILSFLIRCFSVSIIFFDSQFGENSCRWKPVSFSSRWIKTLELF
jgi:hypothetical protein